MNVVITGANRGIGLEFVRHYLEQGCQVWAGYRSDKGGLAELKCDALHPFWIDVAADVTATTADLPERIDILINNAGIYGPTKGGQSLEAITPAAMLDVFNVDCIGPLRVVQALKERVIATEGVIANISSKMGSSDDNSSGGTYAYRAAKAALVIVTKSMAMDLLPFSVRVVSLHPGWVKTDMTNQTGLIDAATSVAGMTDVIANVDNYEPGSFIAYDGKLVPY